MLARYRFHAHCSPPLPGAVRPLRHGLAHLAARLPSLGCVLCCARADASATRVVRGAGGVLLLDDPRLCWLGATARVEARSAVTRSGPREWLRFEDAGGDALACLYLLPDTDWLAWDALLDACGVGAATEEPCARAARIAPRRAELLRFRCLHVGRLTALGCETAERVSPLGRAVAAEIAGNRRGVPA
ncbi:hypothetical protein MBSD_n0400 [Mizugakiibacter sediminis]|uniref:Uncharacterized protein n=1 Tax=Mizugakiibacter sediminis TaxID=1475481 RepID=A0A0K8QK89_9GAMM|nr:hypothetical protein [Mizugakiibacter sediminis]GAP65111.1 hypothetical protein MBSD_n0400 [Mizugakiibacter sediminis]